MITGFFNINKPSGLTSAAVVGRVKRIIRQKDLGHMGTLDPMASGVLIVAAGRGATKQFDILHKRKKEYVAGFKFGTDTDTLDTTGKVISSGGAVPDEADLRAALPKLTGKLMQMPPAFSAKSVNGEKAYKIARRGETVILSPKEVEVFSFSLLSRESADTFVFKVICGGGTYIRSLARDLGALLGTTAVMSSLVRTESAGLNVKGAVTLEELSEGFEKYIIPVGEMLDMQGAADGNKA